MKIVVIVGGAAGFFAAIHAARDGCEVTLLEKSNKVLAKVKVSGGGRCNVTNACTDPRLLVGNYPRGSKELLGPFTRFGTVQTMQWFADRGVALKAESDGRVFPVTDSSQTIIDCLLKAASSSGVAIRYHSSIQKITKSGESFNLLTAEGGLLTADKIIVATGGNPSVKSYEWLSDMGHTIISPVPSLFTFNILENPMQDLMGLSVSDCNLKIHGTKLEQRGPVLFTHWGISGPAVLKLSAWAARWLSENQYQFKVSINLFPDHNEMQLREELVKEIQFHPSKLVYKAGFRKLPFRLWERLCALSGIDEKQKWNEISKKLINQLIEQLSGLQLAVGGKTTFKE